MRGTLYIGIMSGTSVDGLDLAILDIRTNEGALSFKVIDAKTVELPKALRTLLISLGQPDHDNLDQMGQADVMLGQFIGTSINIYLDSLSIERSKIAAIGSHGQTIRHRPKGESATPFSLQIGDPNSIAEITKITTVADFRRRDIAAGGEGAPLAPGFHKILFSDAGNDVAVLNIGGISNLTIFKDESLIGFDSGPGNCMLDEWAQKHNATPFDHEGAWAASGLICNELLNLFLADPYFAAEPPKSTGREYFNMNWLNKHLANAAASRQENLTNADVQATLLALTASSIVNSLSPHVAGVSAIAVCGGGRLNSFMIQRISSLCQQIYGKKIFVAPTEQWGVDGDSLEAAAFAWLAYQRINAQPGNLPSVTGARGTRILGAIYPGLH
jgi:anhydro-N-acetylmuramic acid kinase